jgi:hypothetical protein
MVSFTQAMQLLVFYFKATHYSFSYRSQLAISAETLHVLLHVL